MRMCLCAVMALSVVHLVARLTAIAMTPWRPLPARRPSAHFQHDARMPRTSRPPLNRPVRRRPPPHHPVVAMSLLLSHWRQLQAAATRPALRCDSAHVCAIRLSRISAGAPLPRCRVAQQGSISNVCLHSEGNSRYSDTQAHGTNVSFHCCYFRCCGAAAVQRLDWA